MRFLICSLETPGFLYPAIGLAKTLKARGHEVAFVADIQCAGFLEGLGFQRFPRGVQDGASFNVEYWFRPPSVALQVGHIEYALSLFGADALVGNMLTLGPLIVAERHSLPVGLVGFCSYLWPVCDDPAEDGSPNHKRLAWRHQDMLKWLNQARALFHMPAYEGGVRNSPLLGDLFLIRSICQMEPELHRLPPQVHLIGDCLWEPDEVEPKLEDWLSDSKGNAPLVYVQHGRFFQVPSFWNNLMEALRNLGCRVISSTSRLDSETRSTAMMPEQVFIQPHVPQGRCLRAAQAAVASANTTVVLGALKAGIPILLIPGGGEQPDVAEACVRAGVAKILSPEEASAHSIQNAVEEILSDSRYRERAALISSELKNVNGFELASDLLERLAKSRGKVLRRNSTRGFCEANVL